jgi:Sec7-like guanine-nucleotide exchange factor
VFFTSIFLRILESPNSTFYQKTMVLQLLHTICRDPQTVTHTHTHTHIHTLYLYTYNIIYDQVLDIDVNYDCDRAF